MLWIYGKYHFFKRHRVSERSACPHCGRANRVLRSYSAWEFFHLMFVPLFPMGTIRAVFRCPTCLRFYQFTLKGRKLKAAIAERREMALGRASEDVNAALEDVVAMTHLGDFEGVESLLEKLAGHAGAVCALAQARFLELQGLADQAEAGFRRAAKDNASSREPHFWLGRFLLQQGRDAEAIAELQQSVEGAHDHRYLGILQGLVELRKRQANWEGLTAIMCEIQRLQPDAAQTKGFSKLLAKACKKSGQVLVTSRRYA